MGLKRTDELPPERKKTTTKDRLEPEVLALRKDRKKPQENARSLLKADQAARRRNDARVSKLAQDLKAFAVEKAEAIPALIEAQRLAGRQGDQARVERLKGLLGTLKRPSRGSTVPKLIRAGKASRIVDEAFKAAGDESR